MPDPIDIYSLMRRQKQSVNDADVSALKEQSDAYQGVANAIQQALSRLLDQRTAAEERGEGVGLSWLFRQNRLTALLDQAKQQIDRYATRLGPAIGGYQRQAAAMAEDHAIEAVAAQVADAVRARVLSAWNRLPVGAIDHLIGVLADGTPLTDRLAQIAAKAVPQIRAAIVQGVAVGKGAKAIAKDVSDAANVARDDALRLVRTETMRAYRSAAQTSMQKNPETVAFWVWVASRSARTCAACLAMDGTEHPIDEPMASHICCRCVPSPRVQQSDADASAKPRENAEEWLRRQEATKQDDILGSHAAGEAFRAGKVSLDDFVGVKKSEAWGNSVYVRSLKGAMKAAER